MRTRCGWFFVLLLSYRLINWREIFKPITKRGNRNHVITFDSDLKTVFLLLLFIQYPSSVRSLGNISCSLKRRPGNVCISAVRFEKDLFSCRYRVIREQIKTFVCRLVTQSIPWTVR